MAKQKQKSGFAQQSGRWVGRSWRWLISQEQRALEMFIEQRVPISIAKALVWIAKLAVFGILLYAAFWLAMLLVFAIAVAWTTQNVDWDDDMEPEWRDGMLGFGLYHPDGSRIDPHDPDQET